jgi:hypothetical protein
MTIMTTMKTTIVLLACLAAPAFADGPGAQTVPHALVIHVAPLVADNNKPIELVAQIDAPFAEALSARWRHIGETAWKEVVFDRSSAGGWYAELPASSPPGIEYYIRGKDTAGVEVAHFASESSPHVVRVVPSLVDRLETLDRARLHDLPNEISFDVIGHNFGNRYGLADRFVRAELAYTRRTFRELYSITFGFGSISGTTPIESAPRAGGGDDTGHSLRYGFGGARLRASEGIFFDARAQLGGSHDGFDAGVAGTVTLGKPWRSNVSIGGEYLHDLGGSAFVRLQWDTAPPLLMGASVVRTDLPGTEIDSAGLYIAYDVAYRVADRFAMRAQLSYGARDGDSHWGGGLGSSLDF